MRCAAAAARAADVVGKMGGRRFYKSRAIDPYVSCPYVSFNGALSALSLMDYLPLIERVFMR